MAYRLQLDEGVGSGVRRIVREQLRAAIDQLEGRGDPDRDAAIHDARKRLKKSRSALRLVRHDLGNALRRRENQVLRDAARRLAAVRDAHVLVETLDALVARHGAPTREHDAARPLRSVLVARREELRNAPLRQEEEHAAVRELRGLLARVENWPLEDESPASAQRGLKRIHRRGGRAMASVAERGEADAWHEWRKRAKDLWYSARILSPVAASDLRDAVEDADRLSEVLGEHNDVEVLGRALEEHARVLEPRQHRILSAALERRRDELRREALALGGRLYAERPSAFAWRVVGSRPRRAATDRSGAR